jgi:formamidopyrimidine-DNA glycosylase
MAWAVDEVRRAGQPIHIKVRDHLRVRNRHGEPCPRCGTTIRREGVRGYDVFYCPSCQPPTRRHFIDWRPEARGPTGGGGTPAPEG